jgi:hypothetical protein
VQLSDVRLGLDTPPGFSDAMPTGSPRLHELAEALTPASNRILMFAIPDGDLRRFMTGDAPELRRYMLVTTPKSLEHERLSPGTFKTSAGESFRALGKPLPADTDLAKHLASMAVGQASLVAELRKDADAFSALIATRLPSTGGVLGYFATANYIFTTRSVMLVRGKSLDLSVYTVYEGPADVEWIRTTTVRWIEELRRLNPR